LQWLMVPYRDNGKLTHIQKNYNTVHATTRCVVEHAFALLKGRFRRLKYLDMRHMEDIVQVILTCCVFHNICLTNEDDIDLFLPSDFLDNSLDDDCAVVTRSDDVSDDCGKRKRDEIAETLL